MVYAVVEVLIRAAPAGLGSGDGELSPLSPLECSLKTQTHTRTHLKDLEQLQPQ